MTDGNSISNQSGGVDIDGQSVNIGGDVVGRDKIVATYGYTVEHVNGLLAQIASTFQPKSFDGRCPYRGLDAFTEDDADRFFGRERLVKELLERVSANRFVLITGPSGSGKSSLARAGLLHALKQGGLPDLHSERWLYTTLTPDRNPIDALASAVSQLKSPEVGDYLRQHVKDADALHKCAESALNDPRDQRVVIFVDQFEEVFTQIIKEEERIAFLNLLTRAATIENGRVTVLLAMRSDFVSNCATYPALSELINQASQFMLVGAMQPAELVSAIAQPALRVGLKIDPDLIAQIVNDMGDEPGSLPLMQFALKDLFDAQQVKGGVVASTLNDYLARGGLHKALERHAEESFKQLTDSEQQLARTVFSGLIEPGRGTADTRRAATLEELIPANVERANVEAVIRKLADARLLTTDEQDHLVKVTLAHEALIDAWPWLRKLVNENRETIALQNQVTDDAQEWKDNDHNSSYLYTGARLAAARENLAARRITLANLAQTFVQVSRARQQRRQRQLAIGIIFLIFLLALAVIVFSTQSNENSNLAVKNGQIAATAQGASTLAVQQRDEAQRQSRIALSQQLAAQARIQGLQRLDLGLLLSLESFRIQDSSETRGAVLNLLQTNPRLSEYLRGHTDLVWALAYSPDGHLLASTGKNYSIHIWAVDQRNQLSPTLLGHTDEVVSLEFTNDDKLLVSAGRDGQIIFWDLDRHSPIRKLQKPHGEQVYAIKILPDGKSVISVGSDRFIRKWDIESGNQIEALKLDETDKGLLYTISSDCKLVAASTISGSINAVRLWNVMDGKPVGNPLQGPETSDSTGVSFSPDGTLVASGYRDGSIYIWDRLTGQLLGTPIRTAIDTIWDVQFSPDGKRLVSSGGDGTIRIWDVISQQQIDEPLVGHVGDVNMTTFSPDGRHLASGAVDGNVILWDLNPSQRISKAFYKIVYESNLTNQIAHGFYGIKFSPDNKLVIGGHGAAVLSVWGVSADQNQLLKIRSITNTIGFAIDPANSTVAFLQPQEIIFRDIASWREKGEPIDTSSFPDLAILSEMTFSNDGRLLVSNNSGSIIIWDMTNRQVIAIMSNDKDGIVRSTLSPDGDILVTGTTISSSVDLWDLKLGKHLNRSFIDGTSVAISPDGKLVAAGRAFIRFWDVVGDQQVGQKIYAHNGAVNTVAFSPDGKTLASGSSDKTIRLWDVATHQELGTSILAHDGSVNSIAFSPDGKLLVSGGSDDVVRLWDVDPDSWVAKACLLAGRNFTQEEWRQYFPNEPYRKTCPQWPEGK